MHSSLQNCTRISRNVFATEKQSDLKTSSPKNRSHDVLPRLKEMLKYFYCFLPLPFLAGCASNCSLPPTSDMSAVEKLTHVRFLI